MGYGGYAGDPRGRESAIEDRQRGRDDVQSQVDSFRLIGNDREGYDWVRVAPTPKQVSTKGPSQDRMRFRTYSAPLPTPKTPVQKAYNEIRTKTPDMTAKKSVTPTPKDVSNKSITPAGATSIAALAATTAIAVKQRASDIKQIQGFLKSNQGLSLTEAQKAAIRYGSKVPNALAKQAYGAGSWAGWWGARTSPHHFGPVEFATKGLGSVGKMLGPVGLLDSAYKVASGGTTALLEATGGQDFYSKLGSKIAQKTDATKTPQSAWTDLLAWVNKQTSQMEGN